MLIVDDDEGMRDNLAELFRSLGFQVRTACSPSEALAVLSTAPVDLLVTDYRMPGATGVELIRAVRRTHPDVRSILMTAFGDRVDETEAVRQGAAGYIAKPFEVADVTRLVERILSPGGNGAP